MTANRFGLIVACAVALSARPGSAAILNLPADSPLDVAGVGTLTCSPTPATSITEVTGADYTRLFPSQGYMDVDNGLATLFQVPVVSEFNTGSNLNPPTAPFYEYDRFGFNTILLDNGQSELVFYYATLQQTFTLSGDPLLSTAWLFRGPGNAAAVPEPPGFLALGVGLLGLIRFRQHGRRCAVPV